MKQLKRLLRYLTLEPSVWLLCCFFQPVRFRKDFETRELRDRMLWMLRLTPLIFFCSYPAALIIRIFLATHTPNLYSDFPSTPSEVDILRFLSDATWAAALSCLITGLICALFSIRFGIAGALAMSLAMGIIVTSNLDTLVSIVSGIAFGLFLGITFNSVGVINSVGIINRGRLRDVRVATFLGIVVGLVVGLATGSVGGYWAGYVVGSLGGPALQQSQNSSISGSVIGLIVGAIAGILLVRIIGAIVGGSIKGKDEAVDIGTKVAMTMAGAFGVAIGIPVGDVGKTHGTFINGIMEGNTQALITGVAFLACYLLCFYRLPLYPISAFSTIRAYFFSRDNPRHILYQLRRSSLHWDECVFLPLPFLKRMLLLASEQSPAGVLEEIDFIVQERLQQRWAAQATAYELALRDLDEREILHDIGQAYQQLAVILPQEVRDLSPHAATIFRYLEDASREAASYHILISKSDRCDALERMIGDLEKIRPNTTFRDIRLNRHLEGVVRQWNMLARQVRETLRSSSESSISIENPYVPGRILELDNPLFVGRDDVAQKLGVALRRSDRPTFLLNGERRMGKSSILKQLPTLLGGRYLPVFYDLQSAGMCSSTPALFDAIARGIVGVLKEKGMAVIELERSQLEKARRVSEAAVYDRFELWLLDVEHILDREDRILLLMLDEFEELNNAGRRGDLDLALLFGWFRSVIQNRSRCALIFSGAKTISDLGPHWAGYFVNVEGIKVSFLRSEDAYHLIAHPVPLFPGEQIFGTQVIEEVQRATRGHPFLIQAVCKQLIERLNNTSHERAEVQDVWTAVEEIFESWAVYFSDLWNRADPDQRSCMITICNSGEGDVAHIMQHSSLDKLATYRALETLQRRDIFTNEHNNYSFAVPIFAEWVKRNQHILSLTTEE